MAMAHRRVVGRHHRDAGQRLIPQAIERLDQRLAVERRDFDDGKEDAFAAQRVGELAHLERKRGEERVDAGRDDEGELVFALLGERRGGGVAAVAEAADRLLDLLDRRRANAAAAIEHAVDGRQTDARRPRQIVNGRPIHPSRRLP